MDKAVFHQLLRRAPASHKYDFGHVLVVGGSPGMVGAPFLAGMAALRSGAGLVTVASEPAVIDKLEKRTEEIMTLRLSESAAELKQFIKDRKVSVIVIGPGMKPDFALQALKQVETVDLPVIVDGGGLAALQQTPKFLRSNMILTPHLGEFQRFFNKSLPKQADQLIQIGLSFAYQNGVILVLKGHPTFIWDGKNQYENNSGGPELATAGTGDVLTGVIAAFIAQSIKPFQAAQAAVYLHGLGGQLAAKAKTEPGVIASDVINAIPAAFKLVLEKEL